MLAGYVSANRVDLARVNRQASVVSLYEESRFVSRDYKSLESILSLYLKRQKPEISTICFGVAGPVIGDEVRPTNLSWRIIGEELRQQFGFKYVTLINDIVATAHGLAHLGADDFFALNHGHGSRTGNMGLIAASSGLGEAIIYNNGGPPVPQASEGGHADFAPGSQLEAELWEYVYADKGYVEAEDIVSWTGLELIYNFLTETQGMHRSEWFDSAQYRASAVIEQALSGQDETANRALEIFIDCYASEAANLALKGMTLGGIYVGGQIAPRILTALDQGRFMQRFVKPGKMESLLADIPVRVIIEDRAALIGAAAIARGL
ncbi:MAG: glucokinase [candidate division Zixibacteria bacterium]|jgi:glucokinase|nr:glucokinase [candidate division Zixibacteria bacterium]